MNNNLKFAKIAVGDNEVLKSTISDIDLNTFISISGDKSLIHSSNKEALKRGFNDRVVHGALIISKVSSIIGTKLPGDSALLLDLKFKFSKPLYTNQEIVISASVKEKHESVKCLTLDLQVRNVEKNMRIASGEALVKVNH
jgi:acyl dehydratase